jgi:hypothetical protein
MAPESGIPTYTERPGITGSPAEPSEIFSPLKPSIVSSLPVESLIEAVSKLERSQRKTRRDEVFSVTVTDPPALRHRKKRPAIMKINLFIDFCLKPENSSRYQEVIRRLLPSPIIGHSL